MFVLRDDHYLLRMLVAHPDYIGDALYHLRVERNLTQTQIGARMDPPSSKSAVSRWEDAERALHPVVVLQMVDAIGCSLDEVRAWVIKVEEKIEGGPNSG